MSGDNPLTNATGFFFERDGKLFLISNRHVVLDEATEHRPNRLEIEFHVDPDNLTVTRMDASTSTAHGTPMSFLP
jgi:hypothetical protein